MQTTFSDFVGTGNVQHLHQLSDRQRRELGDELAALTHDLGAPRHAADDLASGASGTYSLWSSECISNSHETSASAGTYTVNQPCGVQDCAHDLASGASGTYSVWSSQCISNSH